MQTKKEMLKMIESKISLQVRRFYDVESESSQAGSTMLLRRCRKTTIRSAFTLLSLRRQAVVADATNGVLAADQRDRWECSVAGCEHGWIMSRPSLFMPRRIRLENRLWMEP